MEKDKTCPYDIGDYVAVRSKFLMSKKLISNKESTVVVCKVTGIKLETCHNRTEHVVTLSDAYTYGTIAYPVEVKSSDIIGISRMYWFVDSHNKVRTDWFYRDEDADQIRIATGNCFDCYDAALEKAEQNREEVQSMKDDIGCDDIVKWKVATFNKH